MSPTYVYRCIKCGVQTEKYRSLYAGAEKEIMCGDCLEPMEKVIQPVGVVFKGNGWGSKP
jgi:putative FmdB family regulatory protein